MKLLFPKHVDVERKNVVKINNNLLHVEKISTNKSKSKSKSNSNSKPNTSPSNEQQPSSSKNNQMPSPVTNGKARANNGKQKKKTPKQQHNQTESNGNGVLSHNNCKSNGNKFDATKSINVINQTNSNCTKQVIMQYGSWFIFLLAFLSLIVAIVYKNGMYSNGLIDDDDALL